MRDPDNRPRFDVVVLAELNVDVIMKSDRDPQFAQVEQQIEMGAITLGSSGAITAAALTALGLRVAICGVIGDDRVGELVITMLGELGVDVSAVSRTVARGTGITVVLTRPDGDRALMTFPGTMADFSVTDIPVGLLTNCRHVHISSIYLQSALAPGLVALLPTLGPGVTVSLDPGWDPSERWTTVETLLPHVDWFMPNANECLAVAGGSDLTTLEAAQKIAALGPNVVVKMGVDGALTVPAGGGPAEVVRGRARVPVDTTGAGDNFNAGFIAALLGEVGPGGTMGALAVGCACGASSISGIGGTGHLTTAPEAAELADSFLSAMTVDETRSGTAVAMPAAHDGGPEHAEHQDLEHR